MIKHIKKETLDDCIRVYLKYWEIVDVDILDKKNNLCKELSYQAYGDISDWLSFSDLISSITRLMNKGRLNIINETIYNVFEKLGFVIEG